MKMTLEDLGYNKHLEKFITDNNLTEFEIGRVTAEHKERYIVSTAKGEFEAEITGNMRFTARSREDFPAVGDWVLMSVYDSDSAIIHRILPRFSVIRRQAPKKFGEVQIIATNIDYAFIVQSADRDFNINRIERYLTICNSSEINPVVLISKTDLADDSRRDEIRKSIKARIRDIPVIEISNETKEGYEELKELIKKGMTYCMLGSSGAGKSTLLNNLSGRPLMKTGPLSRSTGKGMHVTSHRELFLLENGGILIDNPGMREVGIADATEGLESTFNKISELSRFCKFSDCTHVSETGCAVKEAVEKGEIDNASYANYLKMKREKDYFESTVAERRKKDKIFGKILKDYQKKDIKQKGH